MSLSLYSTSFDGLPVTTPVGCPHVIRLGPHLEYDSTVSYLRIADGVATLLFHYNPDVLTRFLDKNVSEFDFLRKDPVAGDLTISRLDDIVFVGRCVWSLGGTYWKTEMKFEIEEGTGIWKPFYLNGACVHFDPLSDTACIQQCDYFGAKLAQEILLGEEWRPGIGLEFQLTTKSG
ncbi:hypothetical protein MMC07_005661 [Pseudocyphellaria aurata]|nr:hypothetical protein [Pseudocyphellaria aurata]